MATELEQALQLSRQLLTDVREKRWEAAANREEERRRLIRQGIAADELQRDQKVALLREIQSLQREIESIGRRERDELAKSLRKLHQGKKAHRAYHQTG
jgi:hypothetical protein